jgi:hypothetical protein
LFQAGAMLGEDLVRVSVEIMGESVTGEEERKRKSHSLKGNF